MSKKRGFGHDLDALLAAVEDLFSSLGAIENDFPAAENSLPDVYDPNDDLVMGTERSITDFFALSSWDTIDGEFPFVRLFWPFGDSIYRLWYALAVANDLGLPYYQVNPVEVDFKANVWSAAVTAFWDHYPATTGEAGWIAAASIHLPELDDKFSTIESEVALIRVWKERGGRQ